MSNQYKDFLDKHAVYKSKSNEPTKIITNTRIGGDGIHGGSYHIPDEEYDTFLKLYNKYIISTDKLEYLTEKQQKTEGPILVDLDFRHTMETNKRQYSIEHIEDIIDAYLDELSKIYQIDSSTNFQIFVLEKDNVNVVVDKKCTKDGIHIIIGIESDHITQQILRQRMIKRISEIMSDFPMINTWDDVFDEGISKGSTNWQLYGSCKPNHERYKLTQLLNISYDDNDGEFIIKSIKVTPAIIEQHLNKMSIRTKNNASLFMKNEFITIYEEFNNRTKKDCNNGNLSISNIINAKQHLNDILDDVNSISNMRTKEDVDNILNAFLDSVSDSKNDCELKESHDYVMALPESYYGSGSHDKWKRVGWALKNTSKRMLIVWIAFSAKSSIFQYSSIPELCNMWTGFEVRLCGGLTKLSLMHWAKTDAFEEYDKVRRNTIDYHVERTISSSDPKYRACDFDLANVLHQVFKHEFSCVSVSKNMWYRYKQHRWEENDAGTTLRKSISVALRDLYFKKSLSLLGGPLAVDNLPPPVENDDDANPSQSDIKKKKSINAITICQRLANTNDKKNIMIESKELFYDGNFLEKLDNNPYLLCFKNGVIDFKTKTFRKGQPEDYISLCTNIDYIQFNDINQNVVTEINNFMSQLFPEPELKRYMWEHLAASLLGTSANQTFNMYIGGGQNGKSVLVNLMEKVLGDYKGDVPLTLVTEKRGKVGGLTPEIVQLKGLRYAVMQEPSKGDVINEGIMKQLTSGKDPLQGRAPYMPRTISFLPQFDLIVTCNTLMTVKSNDHGTWRRIRTVPFKSLFTENPIQGDADKPYQFKLDKHLDEKFDSWSETFASMLVDVAFKTNGIVTDCDIVMAKTKEYRQSQDYISEFINDRIVKDSAGRIKKMELNNEFTIWYMSNVGGKGPSPKDLHEYMDAEFGRSRNQVWTGGRINYDKRAENYENDEKFDDNFDDIEANDL